MTRIRGLDALRFLCALCVVQGHLRLGGYLILDQLRYPRELVRYVRIAFNQGMPIPTGPNAVVVFFAISGFCIHFPYRNGRKFIFRQFIVRRYLRVGLPAIVAAVMLYNTGFHVLQDSVLWSIICEMIYYSIYPVLMALRYRFGWPALLATSYAAAYLIVATHMGGTYNGDFVSLGTQFTWVLGLPCWLLGCMLAENYSRFHAQAWHVQWAIRFGIISLAAIGTTLRFYAQVGYYWSEPLLGIFVFFWLGTEIAYFTKKQPWQWLERCGSWSYSVYLYHAPISIYVGNHVVKQLSIRPRLLVEVAFVLVVSFVLYCIVERPAHLLGRRFMATTKKTRAVALPAVSPAD